jgi:hypothetical protein
MIQIIKNLISEVKLMWPFSSVPKPLVLTRTTEKFDMVTRVPKSIMIKM